MSVGPRRSVLLVPGSGWDRIVKAAAHPEADAVCIDLEDAVAPNAKAEARTLAAKAFRELDFGRKARAFRMNALDGPFAYRDVIEVVEAAGASLDAIVVPKVEAPADLLFVATLLTQIEAATALPRPVGLEALIETAAGGLNVREIAAATPRLQALIFGSGDYAASMRMPLDSIGGEDEHDAAAPGRVRAVQHAIVAAARANDLRAVDGPFAAFRDEPGLTRACAHGVAMGFDGKWCIHPAQVPAVNAAFSPTPEPLAHARRVLDAVAAAEADGRGALTLDGRMLDAASVRMAHAVLSSEPPV